MTSHPELHTQLPNGVSLDHQGAWYLAPWTARAPVTQLCLLWTIPAPQLLPSPLLPSWMCSQSPLWCNSVPTLSPATTSLVSVRLCSDIPKGPFLAATTPGGQAQAIRTPGPCPTLLGGKTNEWLRSPRPYRPAPSQDPRPQPDGASRVTPREDMVEWQRPTAAQQAGALAKPPSCSMRLLSFHF